MYSPEVPSHAVQDVAPNSKSTMEPAAQAAQALCPAVLMYSPSVPSQAVHADAPADVAIVPATQSVHTDAPVVAAIVPGSHSVHAIDPAAAAIVPAAQSVHAVDPAAEYLPAVQAPLQVLTVRAVDAPKWPASQLSQEDCLVLAWNLPLSQLSHAVAQVPADGSEYLPAAQSSHSTPER